MSGDAGSADPRRRRVLTLVGLGTGGLAALAVGVPVGAAVLQPAWLRRGAAWRDVGVPGDFTPGVARLVIFDRPGTTPHAQLTTGDLRRDTAWVTREDGGWLALQNNCLHLGCPVRYQPGSRLYLCPCHGGVYDARGVNLAGPPRAPLVRLGVREQAGRVQVRAQALPLPDLLGRPR
ncbi:ubiquinol-cytochrome c reductase iron-sulfur subunit [Deinococcus sp. KSM4-11]|uniref:QcrA and Rieske domain-containing protein n=1 Tax=Deinococcus sp. KSM4-11 TaxID=2568654 RepID=UPI001454BC24|nr:Rieske 2Fe-2S domain-containing protein [Deinococcus sp. KSM4-11]